MMETKYTPGVKGDAKYSPYYGAGMIQLTWRDSYDDFNNSLAQPDSRILEPENYATLHVAVNYPAQSACWFWTNTVCQTMALNNNISDEEKVKKITGIVKNSTDVAAERYAFFTQISSVIK